LKPYGLKPYGLKPYGLKPYGLKPYGLKPYGLKPYGLKPYGLKGGPVDLGEEWSADVSALVTERSAVIRLGGTVVGADQDVRVPVWDPDSDEPVAAIRLGSKESGVTVLLRVPNRLERDLAGDPELSEPLKADLAEHLAAALDEEVLALIGEPEGAEGEGDRLVRLRGLVESIRDFPLRNPGWIIDRGTFDKLTKLPTENAIAEGEEGARSLDSYGLIRRDGVDGGTLLGFAVVTCATEGVFFSADWDEAWIGIERNLVNVAVSAESGFAADETVIRATMSFDARLRRDGAFARTSFGP
jgi:hypothetical protein